MSCLPRLKRGRVYTAGELGGSKQAQLYRFAVKAEPLGKGLYWVSPDGSYGETKPTDLQILSVLLRGKEFLITGNERWDALGLSVTRPLGGTLVYTMRRAGEYRIGGRLFRLVRGFEGVRRFPTAPVREWWIVDLLENLELAGLERDAVLDRLSAALAGASLPRTGLVRDVRHSAPGATGPRARPKRQQKRQGDHGDAPSCTK